MKYLRKILPFLKNKINIYRIHILIRLKAKKEIVNWQEFLAVMKSGKDDDTLLVKLKCGIQISCRKNDLTMVAETWVLGDYKKAEEISIKPGDVVFDVGGHIGIFSLYAAHQGAKVYAFEPEASNYRKLQENIKLNNLEDRITALNYGLAGTSGVRRLDISDNSGGHSLLTDVGSSFQDVAVKTFAEAANELTVKHIDLLKIDIEGGEYELFESLKDSELGMIKSIIGEFHLISGHEQYNFGFLAKLLSSKGKAVNYLPGYFYLNGK